MRAQDLMQAQAKVSSKSGSAMAVPEMSDEEFKLLKEFVYANIGLAWDIGKKSLAYTRLSRRLQKLNLKNFNDYIQFLLGPHGESEKQHLVNAVTTTETVFYRERYQLDYLAKQIMPILHNRANESKRKLRIWSAACSTGEEPYTLAMMLLDELQKEDLSRWDLRILASDVNTGALQYAEEGLYTAEEVSNLLPLQMQKYMDTEIIERKMHYRVKPEVRQMIQFRQINFLEKYYPIKTHFDLIMCRNVLIYFDANTQLELGKKFQRYLHPHGYLCLGHSESMRGVAGLRLVKHNIYQYHKGL